MLLAKRCSYSVAALRFQLRNCPPDRSNTGASHPPYKRAASQDRTRPPQKLCRRVGVRDLVVLNNLRSMQAVWAEGADLSITAQLLFVQC
jgi:hypothetical protein